MNQEITIANGSSVSPPVSGALEYDTVKVAEAVVKAINFAALGPSKVGSSLNVPTFASFAAVLAQLVDASPDLRVTLEGLATKVARQYLVEQKLQTPSHDQFLAWMRTPGAANKGGTVVRAFWWGFHIEISHEDLGAFVTGAGGVNSIVAAIGGGIPSPAQPWILLVAGFIAGALELLQGLDRGRGVYVSMTWFAPGAFVPTSV